MTKSNFSSFVRSCFETNPVFKRELRARWRRPAAYLTLFFFVAPLALGMALIYADKAPGNLDVIEIGEQMATVGRELFLVLAVLQVVSWLLLAPAIASSAIAAERERGLLEALQLANLPAQRVVLGKWLSILSFMGLLFLVPLPVVAICFLFGGVTPEEFGRSAFTIFITAVFGSALGLWFSSRRRRPAHALRDVFVFLLLWSGLAFLSHDHSTEFHTMPLIVKRVCSMAELAHPVSSIARFGGGEFLWPLREMEEGEDVSGIFTMPSVPGPIAIYSPPPPAILLPTPALITPPYAPVSAEKQWAGNLALLAAFSLLFFALAVRGTKQTLPDAAFLRRDWVARLKAYLEKRRQNPLSHAQKALFADVPLLSGRSYDNPIFGRELRGKTRLKGGPWWLWLLRVIFVVAPTLFYIQILAEVNVSLPREEAFKRLAYAGLALLSLYAAVSGAGAFTREHESGTWEGLKLTLLYPGQILSGKIWPLVIAVSVLSLILLPGFLLCLGQSRIEESYSFYRGYSTQIQITLWHLLVAFIVMLSTAFAVGCTAMFVSWLCHRTPLAVGLSLLCGAFLCFLMPVPFQSALTTPVFTLEQLPQPEPKRYQVANYYKALYYSRLEPDSLKQYYRKQQQEADFKYQGALQTFQYQRKSLLWCPVTMLSFGCILLLILSVLMCQQFRDES